MWIIGIAAALSNVIAPADGPDWFEYSDVPMDIVRPEHPMFVGVRVAVTPMGQLQSCTVESSSGSAELDEITCKITRRRAKFRPARWIDATPVWGVFRRSISYIVTEHETTSWTIPADLTLRFSSAPTGLKLPATTGLALAVDESGKIEACEALDTKQERSLVEIACSQLPKSFKPTPAYDDRGLAVRSIQTAWVNFVR